MNKASLSRRTFLAAASASALAIPFVHAAPQTKKLVMVAGKMSHGPLAHEFNAGVKLLKRCLSNIAGLELLAVHNGYPADESVFDNADAVFCYADGGGGHPLIQQKNIDTIGKLMAKGIGLFCAHYAVEVPASKGGKEFKDWIGGYYEHAYSVNPMWTPKFTRFPEHPITRGVKPFSANDEWYFNMRFREDGKVTPILVDAPDDKVRDGPYVYPKGPYPHIQADKGRPETLMWCTERADGGRGAGFTGGHFHKNWKDDNFRKVVLNGLLWVSKLEVPEAGVESSVTEEQIMENLDPKGQKK